MAAAREPGSSEKLLGSSGSLASSEKPSTAGAVEEKPQGGFLNGLKAHAEEAAKACTAMVTTGADLAINKFMGHFDGGDEQASQPEPQDGGDPNAQGGDVDPQARSQNGTDPNGPYAGGARNGTDYGTPQNGTDPNGQDGTDPNSGADQPAER